MKNSRKSGFTLIEIVIVIAIASVVTVAGVIFSFSSYTKNICRNERDNLVTLLYRARGLAINNPENHSYGLHFGGDGYTLFSGNSYNAGVLENEFFPRPSSAPIFSNNDDVVFDALTANVGYSMVGNIVVGDEGFGCNEIITIKHEGAIFW